MESAIAIDRGQTQAQGRGGVARASIMERSMMTNSEPLTDRQEAIQFVERALIDFELLDAFESHSTQERADYLRWVADASESWVQEDRVSQLLDHLALGRPLIGFWGLEP